MNKTKKKELRDQEYTGPVSIAGVFLITTQYNYSILLYEILDY